MGRTDFDDMACSIARSVSIAGDPWTLLILRDVAFGLHRFDELQRDLGIATNVLSNRLGRLTEAEVLLRQRYSTNPARYEYELTDKGRDLVPVLFALLAWGDRWAARPPGPPLLLRHLDCNSNTHAEVTCKVCGEPLTDDSVEFLPGPGGRSGPGTTLLADVLTVGHCPSRDSEPQR